MLRLNIISFLAINLIWIGTCQATCLSNFFTCDNHRCIPTNEVCNYENDCGDWSDEKDCDNHPEQNNELCGPGQFSCDDGHCIPLLWRCDGDNDCMDHSDEPFGCLTNCTGFECNSRQCIPRKWVCDGVNDCGDFADEQNCEEKLSQKERAERCDISYHYLCKDKKKCIEISQVCDHHKDCLDGSDEGVDCLSEYCGHYECNQNCHRAPDMSICSCREGYKLQNNLKTCEDIDECATGTSLCSQLCENLEGGYLCSCVPGYTKIDKGGCTAEGVSPILIYTTTHEVKVIRLRSAEYWTPFRDLERTVAITYDGVDNVLYWNKRSNSKETIMKSKLDGSDATNLPIEGLQNVETLAIDWIGRNLYYTDGNFKHLGVCSLHEIYCAPVLENLSIPTSLILHPAQGFLYWSDWGIPHIGKVGMDGSNPISFVTTDIKMPAGLAIDLIHKRLYWTDAKLNHIESIHTNGHGRKVILQEVISYPFSTDIFEDTIYWTDWTHRSVQSCNKITGKDRKILAKIPKGVPMGLHIYHPLAQPQEPNPCYGSACAHICLLAPKGKYTCKCQTGYNLAQDGRNCLETSTTFILIAMKKELHKYYFNTVGQRVSRIIKSRHFKSVHKMVYDNIADIVYIAQSGQLFGFHLSNSTAFPMLPYNLDVKDIAFHTSARNLYLIDALNHHIGVFNVERRIYGSITVLPSPEAIDILPKEGVMFIALSLQHPGLCKLNMDGKNKQFIIGRPRNSIRSILIDPTVPNIYWIDNKKQAIHVLNIITTYTNKSEIFVKTIGKTSSMLIYQSSLFWLGYEPHTELKWKELDSKSPVFSVSLSFNGIRIYTQPVMTLVDKTQPKPEIRPCTLCSHFCLPHPGGITCSCPLFMTLQSDRLTCIEKHSCSDYEFKCKNGRCVPQTSVCNKRNDCIDGSDEVNCSCSDDEFDCPTGSCIPRKNLCDQYADCPDAEDELDCKCDIHEFRCADQQCISKHWRCDGTVDCNDGSDEADCSYECSLKQFRCPSGRCISQKWLCDEAEDCEDGADEKNCLRDCFFSEFICANGRCVDRMAVCDDFDDCGDGSDEEKCSRSSTCGPKMFQCDNGKCISEHRRCNYISDCSNGEDEKDCVSIWDNTICRSDQFRCSNGHCIPIKWVCDGDKDCPDNEDETEPLCPNTTDTSAQCQFENYKCDNGKCIDLKFICNGENDCKDGSDEIENCELSCIDHNGNCTHICIPTPRGPLCRCRPGFLLSEDEKTCEDINECEEYGTCSHFCSNTVGSFKCFCSDGYALSLNNKTCKAESDKAQIIVASISRIIQLSIDRSHMKIILAENGSVPSSVDFLGNDIYWAKYFDGTINMYNGSTITVIDGLNKPKSIAIDSSAHNIFYADSNDNITVCTLEKEYLCTQLLSTKNILSVALDSEQNLIFWTVNNTSSKEPNGKIYSAWMNGDNSKIILDSKIAEPLDLATDTVLKRLFWVDRLLNVIETAKMNGGDRRTLVSDGGEPVSLTLFEDFIYWASIQREAIMSCNKFKCDNPIFFKSEQAFLVDLKAQHAILQTSARSQCSITCNYICIPTPDGHVCKCPTGYKFMNSPNICESDSKSITPYKVTTTTVSSHKTSKPDCDLNCGSGECVIIKNSPICRCPNGTLAQKCDQVAAVLGTLSSKDNVIMAIVLTVIVVISFIIAGLSYLQGTSAWQRLVRTINSLRNADNNEEELGMSAFEDRPMLSTSSTRDMTHESTMTEPERLSAVSSGRESETPTLVGEPIDSPQISPLVGRPSIHQATVHDPPSEVEPSTTVVHTELATTQSQETQPSQIDTKEPVEPVQSLTSD